MDTKTFIEKALIKIKGKFPPDKNWKFQKQTTPPTFGHAKIVGDPRVQSEISKRIDHCKEVLAKPQKYCDFVPGKISMIVLSCKRWHTLEKLMETVTPYFKEIETYANIEKILVDNGSGDELLDKVRSYNFFDKIVAHPKNLGIIGALKKAYKEVDGEYVLYVEDDFYLDYDKPFVDRALSVFKERPEVGIIRLKNQNNWWKPERVISGLYHTQGKEPFRYWLPSLDGKLNGWCLGSVLFRRASYFDVGEVPDVPNVDRTDRAMNHAYVYEYTYGKKYNEKWLAVKMENVCPFVQPNDNLQSSGWH